MNTFYSVNKFADEFKQEYPDESSVSIFFPINSANNYKTKFGEQTIIDPFYIVAGLEKLNHEKIQEIFGNKKVAGTKDSNNGPVKITFNQTETKKLNKRATFMKLTIDISKKFTFKQKDGSKISYYKWNMTRYENEKLSQAYNEYMTPLQDDEAEDFDFD